MPDTDLEARIAAVEEELAQQRAIREPLPLRLYAYNSAGQL